jgi:hypothetical protein
LIYSSPPFFGSPDSPGSHVTHVRRLPGVSGRLKYIMRCVMMIRRVGGQARCRVDGSRNFGGAYRGGRGFPVLLALVIFLAWDEAKRTAYLK